MSQTRRFSYADLSGLQVLELPYKGKQLSMIVFLPNKLDGLAGLEQKLSPKSLEKWINSLKKQKVRVQLPRFKLRSGYGLKETLKKLGIKKACTDKADFTGLTPAPDFMIQRVIHQSYVDVNERGTEAAAATAVFMGGTGAMPKIPEFDARRPFLFVIRHQATGAILFVGRVFNPAPGRPVAPAPGEANLSYVKKNKAPRVSMKWVSVIGDLDRNVVRRTIRRHLIELKRCYVSKALSSKPDLTGRIKVRFEVNRKGRTLKVKSVSSTLNHKETQKCVVQAHQLWRFPKPKGVPVKILADYGFTH